MIGRISGQCLQIQVKHLLTLRLFLQIHDYTSLIPLSQEDYISAEHNGTHQKELDLKQDGMEIENDESKSNKLVEECSISATNTRKIQSMRAEINHVLLGQQMTCEILTNLCCDSDPDSESWDDDSDMNLSDMVRSYKISN